MIAEKKNGNDVINVENLKKVGKIGLIVVGIAGVGYGVYKLAPRVKQWWEDRTKSDESKKE